MEDIVPLYGVSHDAPRMEAYVVFGIDFSAPADLSARAPTSTRSR